MDLSLRVRLSIMMFLQYFVWGAWVVALSTFLTALPTDGGFFFPGDAVGMIYATSSIGAMISPLFVGLFADRLFATDKVLAVFHLLGAGLLCAAAWLCQTNLPVTQQTFNELAKQEKVILPKTREAMEDVEKLKKNVDKLSDGEAKRILEKQIVEAEKLKEERLATALPLSESLEVQKKLEKNVASATSDSEKREAQEVLNDLKAANQTSITNITKSTQYKAEINKTYDPLLWIMLAYALFYMPTLTLTNSISFRNMKDVDKHFGSIRVLGTIGWIAAGLIVGFLKIERSPWPLFLAAGSSGLLGIFCFALPKTPPSSESKSVSDMLGLPALAMLKSPAFVVFFVCSFLLMIPLAFYYAWANPFLNDINAPFPAAVQTLGQFSEIIFMLAIPFCLRRFGTKGMLLIGMGAWVLRYAIFATKYGPAVVLIGLPLHGICYDFFFVVSYLYVDRKAPKHLRASAQGMIAFITLGVGQFLGNKLAGETKKFFTEGSTTTYLGFWLVPMAVAAVATILFAALFFDKTADAAPTVSLPTEDGLQK